MSARDISEHVRAPAGEARPSASALSIADRGVVLNLGQVVADQESSALAGDERLRHAYLGF